MGGHGEDGSHDFGNKNSGEQVLSQGNRQSARLTVGGVGLDVPSIRAIIDSAMVSYERLPMLEIVFDTWCG